MTAAVRLGRPIPGCWLITGEGERRSDCLHEYQCTTAAAKQSGEARCPDECSAWEPQSMADHDTERDHLALSRSDCSALVEGGGGWRAPSGSGGRGHE